jgi:hypothetical protein
MNDYKAFVNDINALDTTTRRAYDDLHALRRLHVAGGTMDKPAPEPGMEHVLYDLAGKGKYVATGKTGSLWWTRDIYEMTTSGSRLLSKETSLVTQIERTTLRMKPEEISDKLRDAGTKPGEYFVKKLLLLEGAFDDADGGLFTRNKDLGLYISQRLSHPKAQKFSELYTSAHQDIDRSGNDSLLTGVLLYSMLAPDPAPRHQEEQKRSADGGSDGGGYAGPFYSDGGSSSTSHDSSSGCSSSSGSSGCSSGSCGGGGGGCGGGCGS